MTIEINGTTGISGVNGSATTPAIQGNNDPDTGISFGTDEVNIVTGGTERFTVESDGDVTVAAGDFNLTDGNLVVASGHGIDFSADGNAAGMTSELLDDYEEGSCTLTITNTNVAPTFSAGAGNTTGYYVKVGNLCTVCYYSSSFNVSSAGSGSAILSGLPFASANLNNNITTGSVTHCNCFTSDTENGYVPQNSSNFVFIQNNSTAGATYTTGSAVFMMVTVTYRTQ